MSKLSRPILRLQHFRRMLISVLILLIPLVAIPVMWESRLQAENSQRLLAQYEKDFTRKTSALEHRMSVISALPSVLASNRTFQELVKSPFNAIQATAIRAELKTYCELNSDVAEIYLFVPAHDFIYSSHVLFPNGNSLIGTEIDASPLWDSLLDESNMNRYAHHAMSQLYYSFSDPLSVRSELCYQAPVFNSSSGVTMLAAVALNESLFSEYFARGNRGRQPAVFLSGRAGKSAVRQQPGNSRRESARYSGPKRRRMRIARYASSLLRFKERGQRLRVSAARKPGHAARAAGDCLAAVYRADADRRNRRAVFVSLH